MLMSRRNQGRISGSAPCSCCRNSHTNARSRRTTKRAERTAWRADHLA